MLPSRLFLNKASLRVHGEEEAVEAVLAVGVGHAEAQPAADEHGPLAVAAQEEAAHHAAD